MKKIMWSTIGAAVLTAVGMSEAALFTDDFESRTAGVTIDGQGSWFVTPAATTNQAVVVNNPSIAYQGSKYLSMIGGGGAPDAEIAGLNAVVGDETNNLFQYALRFETIPGNGVQTWWDADLGPFKIVHTFFNSLGNIMYWTNNEANIVVTSAYITTDVWYKVSYRAFPSSKTVRFSVNAASNDAVVFDQVIPMDSAGTPSSVYGFQFKVDDNTANHWLIDSVSITSIPEPSMTLLLCCGGIVGFFVRNARNRSR